MPALFGATLETNRRRSGCWPCNGERLQAAFRKHQSALPTPARNWGGRRKSLLIQEEEVAFLKPWLESAASGHLVVVSPFGPPCRNASANRSSLGGLPLVGAPWPAKVAPNTRHRKSKPEVQEEWKKTPRSAGSPADTGRGPEASCAVDVSRRGPLWTHGADSALLGSRATSSGGGQWLRTGVSICLRSAQPAGRRPGLEDRPGHGYRADGNLSSSSQCRPPSKTSLS